MVLLYQTGNNNYIYDVDEFYLDSGQSGFYIREMLHDPDGVDTLTLTSQLKTAGNPGIYFNLNKGASSNFEDTTAITDAATKRRMQILL